MKRFLYILFPLLFAAMALEVMLGSAWIPLDAVWQSLIGIPLENQAWQKIIIEYRIPRMLAALISGSSLGLSGLLMQTFFRNPLAGPYVLGISAGASLGVAMIVFGSSMGLFFGMTIDGEWSLTFGAIVGSFLVFLVVMYFSGIVSDSTSLLIIGLMFSSATGALVSILQFFSNPQEIQSYLIWTFGDLGSVTYTDLKVFTPIIFVGLAGTVFLVKPLNIYLIGQDYAFNAGLNIHMAKYGIITITALLAGATTAYCGPIAFIGLAAPHISRMLLDTTDHKKMIFVTPLVGALILLTCDIISRLPGLPHTLPLNAVTSIFGGPLVIWLIVSRKNLQRNI